ncbi:hypothetical protein EJ05DRAFT_434150 [Pseudovirgaria hyperparasitica]|uniref:Purine transporter n=1 Tax=Pseudovirgaria hyperparasitica TaxID=470096 RepID=A0A6A6WGR4_9PEZI|nr:uncharacterized protein EJ05DRAFT_434150 [Pseudovirgaria hyperparasitica]KAF2762052.1 hypothetical protein EJ05DRAFT_434150 [Pseudovirgaria hyperparasitica]
MDYLRAAGQSINNAVAVSPIGRIYRLDGSGHDKEIENAKFLTEVRAGITTFFTMAYIISVNAVILADSGATCECNDPSGMCLDQNTEYNLCKLDIQRDLITATAAISALSSFMLGALTNLPVALAPGMGLNAYFAYQVVGFHGTGPVPYRLALAAVFIEGLIFVALSLLGMRQWLVRLLPHSLKIASACGIGLFLAEIGLSYSAGIGAITGSISTPLDLAGCPVSARDPVTGFCTGQKLRNPTLWIGIFCGGILTAYLMAYRVKSAIVIGIMVTSIISWPRGTSFTFFPYTEAGDEMFNFFKQVASFRPIHQTLNAIDWNIGSKPTQFALALFTFLYVDIIDCTATMYSMARISGSLDKETGDFPRSTIAYSVDAISISIGALLGTSPVTAYIESGAGIAEGGRTGLTAMTTGLCFLVSVFFAPIFASIPPWATGCTLIIVGATMMRQVTSINWNYIGDVIPAFVTLMFIPFSYSVAYGVIAGIMTYATLNSLIWFTALITGDRIVPRDEDQKEYWTWKPKGNLPFIFRLAKKAKNQATGKQDSRRSASSSSSSQEDLARVNSWKEDGHVIEMHVKGPSRGPQA